MKIGERVAAVETNCENIKGKLGLIEKLLYLLLLGVGYQTGGSILSSDFISMII